MDHSHTLLGPAAATPSRPCSSLLPMTVLPPAWPLVPPCLTCVSPLPLCVPCSPPPLCRPSDSRFFFTGLHLAFHFVPTFATPVLGTIAQCLQILPPATGNEGVAGGVVVCPSWPDLGLRTGWGSAGAPAPAGRGTSCKRGAVPPRPAGACALPRVACLASWGPRHYRPPPGDPHPPACVWYLWALHVPICSLPTTF